MDRYLTTKGKSNLYCLYHLVRFVHTGGSRYSKLERLVSQDMVRVAVHVEDVPDLDAFLFQSGQNFFVLPCRINDHTFPGLRASDDVRKHSKGSYEQLFDDRLFHSLNLDPRTASMKLSTELHLLPKKKVQEPLEGHSRRGGSLEYPGNPGFLPPQG
jgi:hypothetical protein